MENLKNNNYVVGPMRSHLIQSNRPNADFDENLIVIYNRVPKTGSTSFINLAYDLCKRNHFYVLHINITANMHVLSLENQVSKTILIMGKIKNEVLKFVLNHFIVF